MTEGGTLLQDLLSMYHQPGIQIIKKVILNWLLPFPKRK